VRHEHDTFTIDMFGDQLPIDPQAAAATLAGHKLLIIDVLRRHGALGKDGIAARSPLDRAAVCRRLPELKRAGLVKLTGKMVVNTSGKPEREWQGV
jgi:hypothetical protein